MEGLGGGGGGGRRGRRRRGEAEGGVDSVATMDGDWWGRVGAEQRLGGSGGWLNEGLGKSIEFV